VAAAHARATSDEGECCAAPPLAAAFRWRDWRARAVVFV
jgi:hypothetical protein